MVTKRQEFFSIGSASGVRTPILNKSSFSNIDIALPPMGEQNQVAELLSTYDRCAPWRVKRRRVNPGSREAALLTRRAPSARGEAK